MSVGRSVGRLVGRSVGRLFGYLFARFHVYVVFGFATLVTSNTFHVLDFNGI